MLLGTKGLTDHSIRDSLTTMIRRSFAATPLHAILMFYVVARTSELRNSNFAWIIFGVLCASLALRTFQRFFLGHLLNRREKITIWRIVFTTHAVTIGLCWGLLCGLSLHHVGMKASTIGLFALISAVSAGSIVTFSFDLLMHTLFQISILTPLIVSASMLGDENSEALAIGVGFFLTFMILAARGMFRFQRDLLLHVDVVDKQKQALDRSHASLTDAYNTISSMLESIDEAFLTFDANGYCSGQCSEKCKRILGFDPFGRHLSEVLGLEPENRDDLSFWYEHFFSGKPTYEILSETTPTTMQAWKGNRTLKVTFHLVKNHDGSTRAVTMTATDVTKELAAETRATEARERAEFILRVHENSAGFRALIETYLKMIDQMRSWNGGDLVKLRRLMHNMKGGMMMFSARRTSARIYEAELLLRQFTPESATTYIRNLGEQLHSYYIQWRAAEAKLVSQINLFDDEVVKISKKTLRLIEKQASRDSLSRQIAGEMVRNILAYEIGHQFDDYRFHVEETALKLGKKVILKVTRPPETVFIEKSVNDAVRTFVHILNNSIDHGIEKPEDRVKAGKREIGSIHISYAPRADGFIRITIEDDGGGINLAKLRRPDDSSRRVSDYEVVARIFEDGQSTADRVSAVSGQGIGMGAIKSAVEAVQGEIRVLKTSSTGTAFEILLPGLHAPQRLAA